MCFGNDQNSVAILVVSKYCSGCNDAKEIINKLIKEDYLVKIEQLRDHPEVRYVPTLIVDGKQYTGLLKEDEYRKLIPKRPDNKRNNYDFM